VTDRAHRAAAVTDFLQRALVGGALDVAQLETVARAAGLLGKRQQIQHAKAFKKAKRSLGIRSIRDGFGSKGKWAWLLPAKPVKPAKKELDRTKDANTREQARSVIVNLNGLPAELLSGRIPPHWVDGIAASKAIKYHGMFLRTGGVNSSTTATDSSWPRKIGAASGWLDNKSPHPAGGGVIGPASLVARASMLARPVGKAEAFKPWSSSAT
jgi:hypothetical protein